MQKHLPSMGTPPETVVCLPCARRKKQRWQRAKVMGIIITVLATAYAARSAYQQRLLDFRDIAAAAKSGYHWIMRRDHHDRWIQEELIKMRQERDEAKRDTKVILDKQAQILERQKKMEQALRGCLQSQPNAAPERRRSRYEWPFSQLFGS